MAVMVTDVKKSFAAWLEKTFLQWQAKNEKRASLLEFAEYIGYSRPLISMWLAAKRLPGEDGIQRLAELFGYEVYDVLQLPRPNPLLQKINKIWGNIPPEKQQQLVEDAERYEATNQHARNSSKERKTQPRV